MKYAPGLTTPRPAADRFQTFLGSRKNGLLNEIAVSDAYGVAVALVKPEVVTVTETLPL